MFGDTTDVSVSPSSYSYFSSPTTKKLSKRESRYQSLTDQEQSNHSLHIKTVAAKRNISKFKSRPRPPLLNPIAYTSNKLSGIAAGIHPLPETRKDDSERLREKIKGTSKGRKYGKEVQREFKEKSQKGYYGGHAENGGGFGKGGYGGGRGAKTPEVLKHMMNYDTPPFPSTPDQITAASSNEDTSDPGVAHHIISGWSQSFSVEKESYESVSLFAEVRLKEILASTTYDSTNNDKNDDDNNSGPNAIRTAMLCDLLLKITSLYGRFEPLMNTLTHELLNCIYSDYHVIYNKNKSSTKRIDVEKLYELSPYFSLVSSLTRQNEELVDELDVYNAGVNLRSAITKCSVGVRTMFNDARRAIRDMIFKVWAAHVKNKRRKLIQMKKKALLRHWWLLWMARYKRFKTKGYFYDSDSDSDATESESDDELAEANRSSRKSSFSKRTSALMQQSSYERMKAMNASAEESPDSSKNPSPVPTESLSPPPTLAPLQKFQRTSLAIKHSLSMRKTHHRHHHEHRDLKIIKTEDDGTMHCERKQRLVDLKDTECQTDLKWEALEKNVSADNEAVVAAQEKTAPSSVATTKVSKKGHASLSSMLGKGKEKPMSIDAAMALIPDLYDQYLVMLSNPGPDTVGKHLHLITFTKNALIRKFGIKTLATKQFKAFIACIASKKATEFSRLRMFAKLVGLKPGGKPEDANPYDEVAVDFFFKNLLKGLFPDVKKLEGCLNSKTKALDTDQTAEAIEEIFPNIRRKGGFQVAHMERMIERMPQMVIKGIDHVNADDVIELLQTYGNAEEIMKAMTHKNVRCVITFQQKIKAAKRLRGEKKKFEDELNLAYVEQYGNEVINEEQLEEILKECGSPAHHKTCQHIYEDFISDVEAAKEAEGEEKVVPSKVFAKHVYSSGLRFKKSHERKATIIHESFDEA